MRLKKGTLFIVFSLIISTGASIAYGYLPKTKPVDAICVGILILFLIISLKESISMMLRKPKKIPAGVIR
jgi:hypothetical protein